jgi:hypothetical protein
VHAGELVVLTRRVDDNWFEGRIGNRKGIFPVSYVEILSEPGEKPGTSFEGSQNTYTGFRIRSYTAYSALMA